MSEVKMTEDQDAGSQDARWRNSRYRRSRWRKVKVAEVEILDGGTSRWLKSRMPAEIKMAEVSSRSRTLNCRVGMISHVRRSNKLCQCFRIDYDYNVIIANF